MNGGAGNAYDRLGPRGGEGGDGYYDAAAIAVSTPPVYQNTQQAAEPAGGR